MIIGVTGKARSGKDKFAQCLVDHFETKHDRFFLKLSFANNLKIMCQEHFKLDYDQLWGNEKEVSDKRFIKLPPEALMFKQVDSYWTPREIMQELGGFYRRIDYDFWVKQLDYEIQAFKGRVEDFIITDVRHINECEYVKNNKGVLIKIIRSDADEIHGMDHESETALDDMPDGYFDIKMYNNGTLNDLYRAAEDTLDAIVTVENMINKGRIIEHGKK